MFFLWLPPGRGNKVDQRFMMIQTVVCESLSHLREAIIKLFQLLFRNIKECFIAQDMDEF